jgi:hypothetical protein
LPVSSQLLYYNEIISQSRRTDTLASRHINGEGHEEHAGRYSARSRSVSQMS